MAKWQTQLTSRFVEYTVSVYIRKNNIQDKRMRVVLEKSNNENIENCWNNLIVPMTTAWLETTSAKVIKLSEIGQSAAETLNDNSQE